MLHTIANCEEAGTVHGCGLGDDTGARGEEGEDGVLGCNRGLVGRGVGRGHFLRYPRSFLFYEGTDSTEIQGRWQRDLLDEKILREKKEEEEEDSFSQDSRA